MVTQSSLAIDGKKVVRISTKTEIFLTYITNYQDNNLRIIFIINKIY